MTKPPIFLLSSGRSGSTLVQRIFNSYDDVLIWGEHGGFLQEVASAYFRLREHPSNKKFIFAPGAGLQTIPWSEIPTLKRAENWQAWMNWFSIADVDDLFRQFVRALFTHPSAPADHIWGFKEIRYGPNDRVIEFLARLFPDAQFVFLVRNGLNTVSSQLSTFHPTGVRFHRLREVGRLPIVIRRSRTWRNQNTCFWHWHQSGRLRSDWVHFEDVIAGKPVLDRALAAVGKRFGDVQRDVVRSEEGRGASHGNTGDVNQRWRTTTWLSTACVETIVGPLNQELGYASPPSLRFLRFLPTSSPAARQG
jgi:sulfotransferase family protein